VVFEHNYTMLFSNGQAGHVGQGTEGVRSRVYARTARQTKKTEMMDVSHFLMGECDRLLSISDGVYTHSINYQQFAGSDS
jgi:hypothetical protein